MSFHIVNIDSPQCSLSLRDGRLTCKTDEDERSLPLEDVASVIITSFSASIHGHLLVGAAKLGVPIVLCEAFKPVSIVLPANRSTDTLLTRALPALPDKTRQTLWLQTVDAKCQNQCDLARLITPDDPQLAALEGAALGKKPHKEAVCAKYYWKILSRSLGEAEFSRERNGGGLNNLLNYGYAVLLSTTLQKLFGVGLDPTFGLSHVTRERSTPLAYDVMEPFRPCVDWRVVQWAKETPRPWEVTKAFRKWVTAFVCERVQWMGSPFELRSVMEGVVRGLRHAVMEKQARYYRPWTSRNSKWDGL